MPIQLYVRRYLAGAVTLILGLSLHAQQKDSTRVGTVRGSVRDTALNYFLQAATVSIYETSSGNLLAYSMTNTLGEFSLAGLPCRIPLRVKISYIGYETYSQPFVIPLDHRIVGFGEIHLKRNIHDIEDSVVVTPPPVRMHGDTLEFSAAAFSLDKNAVAEDLLKKLPGVIVWGDGTITVNGKAISKLLVDGKPFFGGDVIVATQNIPKNSIDKVQVYQESIDINNPYDSITTINLRLRKDMHSGYFGMFSAGVGSDERYEAGANSSFFTPSDQLALAGQANNVNKIAGDLNTLLRSGTYKGVGARVEYQPDFNLQGSNQPASGGLLLSHDFIPDFNNYKQDRLSVSSYVNHNLSNLVKGTQSVTAVGSDSTLEQNTNDNLRNDMTDVNIRSDYNKVSFKDSLLVQGAFHSNTTDNQNTQTNQSNTNQRTLLSNDQERDSSGSAAHSYSLKASYGRHTLSSIPSLSNWNMTYSLSTPVTHVDSSLKTNFINVMDSTLNLYYDRKYSHSSSSVRQGLSAQLADFASWLFHNNRHLNMFHITMMNDLKWNQENHNDVILDRDTIANIYNINDHLSRTTRYSMVSDVPKLHIGRDFNSGLANRYMKDLSLYADIGEQFYHETNRSDHAFQNYFDHYQVFTPAASIAYTDYQYGDFRNLINLDATTEVIYPGPDQRVPLVDSSNIYHITEGNPALKPTRKYELAVKFRHDSYRSKNTFFYGAGLAGGLGQDYVADSVAIDLAGRYAYYPVNVNGYRYARANAFLSKAFILGDQQFQFTAGTNASKTRTPGYLGYQVGSSGANLSQVFATSDTISLFYTYKDLVAINLMQDISYYQSKQYGFTNVDFVNVQTLTRLGVGVNVTKKLTVNTNVSYNWSSFSNTPVNRYTIWNAYAAYRFLPANNLELKASALDLLNENKGLINTGSNNSFTHGTVNMLHQYFVATLTYYPRKFGRKK